MFATLEKEILEVGRNSKTLFHNPSEACGFQMLEQHSLRKHLWRSTSHRPWKMLIEPIAQHLLGIGRENDNSSSVNYPARLLECRPEILKWSDRQNTGDPIKQASR